MEDNTIWHYMQESYSIHARFIDLEMLGYQICMPLCSKARHLPGRLIAGPSVAEFRLRQLETARPRPAHVIPHLKASRAL